jgi:hypothetical protein
VGFRNSLDVIGDNPNRFRKRVEEFAHFGLGILDVGRVVV